MNADDYENDPTKIGAEVSNWAVRAASVAEAVIRPMPAPAGIAYVFGTGDHSVGVGYGRGVELHFNQETPGNQDERVVALRVELRRRLLVPSREEEIAGRSL